MTLKALSIFSKEEAEEFINKHADKVNWDWISMEQKLSEEFIEQHSDRVSWVDISMYQQLSEEFIEKHADKLDWNFLITEPLHYSKFSKVTIIKIFKLNLTKTPTVKLLKSHNWSYIELTELADKVEISRIKKVICKYRDKNCEQPEESNLLDNLVF